MPHQYYHLSHTQRLITRPGVSYPRSYYSRLARNAIQIITSRTLDSMHARAATAGNLNAPICTDCHGSHYIHPPDEPRTLIPATCGNCHTQEFTIYQSSVHGNALAQESNPDVPVCTTCHGVHNIQDPRTQQFRVEEPDLCASCHANQEMMANMVFQQTCIAYTVFPGMEWMSLYTRPAGLLSSTIQPFVPIAMASTIS